MGKVKGLFFMQVGMTCRGLVSWKGDVQVRGKAVGGLG